MDSMSRVKTVELELRKLAYAFGISGQMLEQLRVTEDYQPMIDQTVYRLHTSVWTEQLPPEEVTSTRNFSYSVPTSWWQHAKNQHYEAWWMRWFARRRPPRLRTINIEGTFTVNLRRFRVYPDAPKLPAHYGRHTALCEINQDVRWITGEGGYGS